MGSTPTAATKHALTTEVNMSNSEKSKALGMSHGTAANRLRKMILFSLVCKLGLDICYQCGKKILLVDDLSIEHKEPWLRADDPAESFFDLDNVAFSHLSCNSGAASRPTKRFVNEKARLRAKRKRWRARRIPEELRQKRRSWYERYGC